MSTPSTPPSGPINEKTPQVEHAERIATHDRVPGHENYYEKNGLRTYGDGEDHGRETISLLSTLPISLALFPIYLFAPNTR